MLVYFEASVTNSFMLEHMGKMKSKIEDCRLSRCKIYWHLGFAMKCWCMFR